MNKNKKDPARAENSRIEVSHRELIQTSWNRCEQYGLNHNSLPVHGSLSKGDLSVLLEEHLQLVNTTQKEVLPYYEHILANSKCMIALADRQGHVLNTWGNQRFSEHQPHGLIVGNQWQEANNGTNAIGTAIATGQAVQVGREEHFLRANRYMVGSAAPIFNTHKEMIGVLDISSDAYLPQDHTLGMVKLMTLTVENRLIFNAFANEHLLITFNTNIASLESPWSGLLAIDERGRIISANRRAEVMLAHDLALVNIEDLFGCKLRELRQQPDGMPLEVVAMGRFRMHILVRTPARMPMTAPDYRLDEKPERNAQQQNPAAELIAAQPIAKATQPLAKAMPQPRSEIDLPDDVVPLAELQHGDERVARMVLQASRIFEKDVPIVLHGETGCGKEVFIRSLHYHSSRRHHQLVALNCAAIPADLVESELFGYERGAFTGANNKGSIGLIRKAHRGTLFLDEIGEMPPTVQARLLRVLQERRVTPLGSTESYPVDIKLVSATNRNLKNEVREGRFRQDLYYRISGLNLELPAFRERADKTALVEYVHQRLSRQAGEDYLPLSSDLLAQFTNHPWPGNVRQLINVLSVALAMADGALIESWHLPDDFHDDLATADELPTSRQHKDCQATADNRAASANDASATELTGENLESRIIRLYDKMGGNISQTAKAAGVSRNTVYKYTRPE